MTLTAPYYNIPDILSRLPRLREYCWAMTCEGAVVRVFCERRKTKFLRNYLRSAGAHTITHASLSRTYALNAAYQNRTAHKRFKFLTVTHAGDDAFLRDVVAKASASSNAAVNVAADGIYRFAPNCVEFVRFAPTTTPGRKRRS